MTVQLCDAALFSVTLPSLLPFYAVHDYCRQTLLAALEDCSKGLPGPWRGPKWLRLSARQIAQIVHSAQTTLAQHLDVGRGIAHNEALCENLFMMLVAVLNSISIFVVGKPGSSKSLVSTLSLLHFL
jgi:hypothetical protein